MTESTVDQDSKRFVISLTGLKPGVSQEGLIDALLRLYPGQTAEQIRGALVRLPLLLARSATEAQARKLKHFLESQGAILNFIYSPQKVSRTAPTAAVPQESTAISSASGVAAEKPLPGSESEGAYSGAERRAKPRVHPGIKVHPMGIGEILDRSFRLLRQNFLLFFLILLIPQGTFFLVRKGMHILVGGEMRQSLTSGMGIGFGISAVLAVLVMIILQFWAQGALVQAVSETYLGHKASIRASYGAMRSRLGRLLGTMILMGILLGLLMLVLFFLGGMIIGGLSSVGGWSKLAGVAIVSTTGAFIFFHFFLNWLLVDKVVVLEDKAWFKALSRSTQLMKSRVERGFWQRPKNKAGLILLMGFLIAVGIHLLFQLPGMITRAFIPASLAMQTAQEILNVVATSLAAVFTAIAMILYYYDIRLRSEGFDLKMMAEHV